MCVLCSHLFYKTRSGISYYKGFEATSPASRLALSLTTVSSVSVNREMIEYHEGVDWLGATERGGAD